MTGARLARMTLITLALIALVSWLAPETSAEEHRVAAQIDEPFEVNGRAFDRGTGGDTMLFERNEQGRLVLVGFYYRGNEGREFFHFRALPDGGRWLTPAPLRAAKHTHGGTT